MGWREILNAPSQNLSNFSYKSHEDGDFSSYCNFNPEDLSEELRFEWMERASIMEYDGGLPRQEAEQLALKIINIKYMED